MVQAFPGFQMLASARKDVSWLMNKPLPGQADWSQVSVFSNGCTLTSHWKQQCHLQTSRLVSDFLLTLLRLEFWFSICVHPETSGLLYGKLRKCTEVQPHGSHIASLFCPTTDPWHFCRASDWTGGSVCMLGSTKWLPYAWHFPCLCQMYLVTWCVNM